jgi:CubicO group peptidase (beta-lactamase class C family)
MKRLTVVLSVALAFLFFLKPIYVLAEVKENEFGMQEGYPYAMGWPFRTIPKFRHGALTGKGLLELEKVAHPFWLKPSSQTVALPRSSAQAWVENDATQLMKQNTIMAMLLIKNGGVIFERYQYGTSVSTLFDSQSIVKTFTALTMGLLADQGTLPNINTNIGDIVPKLKNSPIGQATLRQTLQMQCGHAFKWVDDGAQGSAGKYAQVRFGTGGGAKNLYDYFQTIPAAAPGSKFSYDPHCSDTLSMVMTQLTGKTLRQNFQEKIWQKIGTESRAAWLSPTLHPDLTTGASAFYATLRDYGRLALLFTNQGSYNSVRIVSSAWIKAMHTDTVEVGSYPSNFKRYGYQTWVRNPGADSWYAGLGNYGQRFYIDPVSKSAMVIFALDESHIRTSDLFWEQFRK